MASAAHQLLHQYLQQQAAHGLTHVRLTEEARQILHQPVTVPAPPTQARAQTPPAVAFKAPADDSREEKLKRLAAQAAASESCKALGSFRDVMVFAVGSPNAEIMFIGEAPGAEEEKLREPFVGPAGQLLTKIIQAMGLKRSEVYISNICKFRPKMDDGRSQGSKNRPPSADEIGASLPFITEEIQIIQPRVIIALGSSAAAGLGIEGSVSALRGRFAKFAGVPVMVTYHPSYLLRCESNDGGGIKEKRLVWEDMLKVMEHVNLPISNKQRGYFSKARS
jgi:uracil-DNA glycosylase family 4